VSAIHKNISPDTPDCILPKKISLPRNPSLDESDAEATEFFSLWSDLEAFYAFGPQDRSFAQARPGATCTCLSALTIRSAVEHLCAVEAVAPFASDESGSPGLRTLLRPMSWNGVHDYVGGKGVLLTVDPSLTRNFLGIRLMNSYPLRRLQTHFEKETVEAADKFAREYTEGESPRKFSEVVMQCFSTQSLVNYANSDDVSCFLFVFSPRSLTLLFCFCFLFPGIFGLPNSSEGV
jgi:hypothetical protein